MYDEVQNREKVTGKLVSFLRKLADNLESNQLLPEQLKKVGEFFMSYQFQNEVIEDRNKEVDDFDADDIKKFLTLGWYVYTQILEEKTLSSN